MWIVFTPCQHNTRTNVIWPSPLWSWSVCTRRAGRREGRKEGTGREEGGERGKWREGMEWYDPNATEGQCRKMRLKNGIGGEGLALHLREDCVCAVCVFWCIVSLVWSSFADCIIIFFRAAIGFLCSMGHAHSCIPLFMTNTSNPLTQHTVLLVHSPYWMQTVHMYTVNSLFHGFSSRLCLLLHIHCCFSYHAGKHIHKVSMFYKCAEALVCHDQYFVKQAMHFL